MVRVLKNEEKTLKEVKKMLKNNKKGYSTEIKVDKVLKNITDGLNDEFESIFIFITV